MTVRSTLAAAAGLCALLTPACASRPPLRISPSPLVTSGNAPYINYSLVSGWVGMNDELRFYRTGRVVNSFASALTGKKTYRTAMLDPRDRDDLAAAVARLDFAGLRDEYRGALVYDAPVQILVLTEDSRSARIAIHARASLPPGLAHLMELIGRARTGVRNSPALDLFATDTVIRNPDTFLGRRIAVEGIFLPFPSRLVPTLADTSTALELLVSPPGFIIDDLIRCPVIVTGAAAGLRLNLETLERLDG